MCEGGGGERNQEEGLRGRAEKACLKRKVFKSPLKMLRDVADFKSEGREFHNRGATDPKARSPLVFRRVRGTTNRPWFEDLRERED